MVDAFTNPDLRSRRLGEGGCLRGTPSPTGPDPLQRLALTVMKMGEIKVITWGRLHEAAQEEPLIVKLMEVVLREFPQRNYVVDEELRIYTTSSEMISMWLGAIFGTMTWPLFCQGEVRGARDNPCCTPRGQWHDQQGGGHCILARDL